MSDSTSAVRVVEAAIPTPARYPRSRTRAPFASGLAAEPEEQNTAVETDHVAVERRLLDDALRPGAVALDAGCGRTTRLRFFRDRIVRLVGVDADAAAASENPSVDEYVHADLDVGLPFEDGTFDLVYASGLYDYLPRAIGVRLLQRAMELVKPGGEFLFANFSDEITTDGYMETFMDWPLILRSADDMRDIINAALGGSSFEAQVYYGSNRNIVYGKVRKGDL